MRILIRLTEIKIKRITQSLTLIRLVIELLILEDRITEIKDVKNNLG